MNTPISNPIQAHPVAQPSEVDTAQTQNTRLSKGLKPVGRFFTSDLREAASQRALAQLLPCSVSDCINQRYNFNPHAKQSAFSRAQFRYSNDRISQLAKQQASTITPTALREQLSTSISAGDKQALSILIKHTPNEKIKLAIQGSSLLLDCCRNDQKLGLLTILIDAVGPDLTGEDGNTALQAISRSHASYQTNGTGNNVDQLYPRFYYAADAANVLIEAGADVDLRDESGKTPLIHAVTNDNAILVRQLLNAGADPSIKDKSGDDASSYAQKHQWTLTYSYREIYDPETYYEEINREGHLSCAAVLDSFGDQVEVAQANLAEKMGLDDNYAFEDIPPSSGATLSLSAIEKHLGHWLKDKPNWVTFRRGLEDEQNKTIFSPEATKGTHLETLLVGPRSEVIEFLDIKTLASTRPRGEQ